MPSRDETKSGDLPSWVDSPTTREIVSFVRSAAGDGPDHVPVEDRVAVFDNDGTLWTEKPMPTQLHFIVQQWAVAARAALPLENRNAVEILGTERPQIAKPRNRYVFYPGGSEVPEAVAPNIRNRSYTIAAQLDIDGGRVVLSASFDMTPGTTPAEGMLTLHIGTDAVGSATIRTQPGKFSIAGEGLNVGKDTAEPVTSDYAGESPWQFTGGTIRRVAVDVSGEPFVDLAQEAAMAFARD